MAWVRLDDQFPDHPVIIGLSNKALWLYVSILCRAARSIDPAVMDGCNDLMAFDEIKELREARLITMVVEGKYKGRIIIHPFPFFSFEIDRNREYRNQRAIIYERDGYRCRYCGSTNDLTLDHIVPVSRRGDNSSSNLQTLCRSCNSRKGARLEWPG